MNSPTAEPPPTANPPTANPPTGKVALLLCLLAAVAGAAQFASLRLVLTRPLAGSVLDVLMRGEGSTPFQYRVLVPGIARLFADPNGMEQQQLVSLVWWIEFVACLAFLLATWSWLRQRGFQAPRAAGIALLGVPLACVHLVMPHELPAHYVWDTPALAFTTLLVCLVERRAWTAFLLVFPLATLNRETIVFLALGLGMVAALRRDRATLLNVVATSVAVWVATKFVLHRAFAGNPGAGLYELKHVDAAHEATEVSHLATNLDFLTGPDGWSLLLWFGAGLWLPLLAARGLGDGLRAAGIGFAAYFAITLVVGNVYESRLYGEYVGVLLVAFAAAFLRPDSPAPAR